MDSVLELTASREAARLDSFIAAAVPRLSRAKAQKLIAESLVTLNGHPARASQKVMPGDKLCITIPPPPDETPQPEEIPLKVVYEDDDLLVIDKPSGLTVHPAPGHSAGTLVNALLSRYPDLPTGGDKMRPGIVHRLDRDTSGLILVAKNNAALKNLSEQFRQHQVQKVYLALVKGLLAPQSGTIEAPIGRHAQQRQRMAIVSQGREAVTEYKVVRYYKGQTLLEVMPQTGRTHQIRVHLAAIGFPVVGDAVYGVKSPLFKRQFLHAHCLSFSLPSSGQEASFTSPLPPDLEDGLSKLA